MKKSFTVKPKFLTIGSLLGKITKLKTVIQEKNLKRIICKLCPATTYGNHTISFSMLKMSSDALIESYFTILKKV